MTDDQEAAAAPQAAEPSGAAVAMRPIPVKAARLIADEYGYDQVIIIARRVGEGGGSGDGEHVTTYGRDKPNCEVAAQVGDFLKYKVMGWVADQVVEHE